MTEQKQAEIDTLSKELEQVMTHNVMFAKAAKFVHEDLIIRAKLEGDDSLNISQSALDAILSAITATSEQVEAYRSEIIAEGIRVAATCARSHPHENMNPICELKTQLARLRNNKE